MSAPARFNSFLVKVASRCNLDCDYCYVYRHADQNWRKMPVRFSMAHRAAFATRLATYVRDAGLEECLVVFHGGEPLLAGVEELIAFADQIRASVAPECSADIALQTNGILLTEIALRRLSDANIGISLSIDGPRSANDRHRVGHDETSSFDGAMSALSRLKQYPQTFTGVISVIDPNVEPGELFAFFDEHSPPRLDFLLPDAHHLNPPPGRDVRPTLYSDWLTRAFDIWLDEYPHLSVRTFEALLDVVAGLPSATDAFGFGDVSMLTIETDGSYHGLDVLKIVGSDATPLIGSVEDTEIREVAASDPVSAHRFLLRPEGLCEKCRACPEVLVCGGGSVPHRHGPDSFNQPSVYCGEMLTLISHVRQRLHDVLGGHFPQDATVDVDLQAFEKAESAAPLVASLVDAAGAEYRSDLRQALSMVIDEEPTYASMATTLAALDADQFTALATHPGAVAWQRARRREATTDHGVPLTADGEYLTFLSAEQWGSTDLRVGQVDRWLRIPFGSSVLFEPEDVAVEARHTVAQALSIIGTWRPALLAELRAASRAIQFVCDPNASSDRIVSFSDNSVPGALYVSVRQSGHPIDPYDLADSIIHEHRHQKLYLLERVVPLMAPTEMKVVSPWREDLRPPSGLLHAVFVFVELRRFWSYVLAHGPNALERRATIQLSETEEKLRAALQTLSECPLTPAGRKLVAVLNSALQLSV